MKLRGKDGYLNRDLEPSVTRIGQQMNQKPTLLPRPHFKKIAGLQTLFSP